MISEKGLRQVQKSNATATDSIAEKPAIRSSCVWQEPSPHLALSCVKPISTYKENGRPKANTHKDNNEIPLRAREVLPGNRKDFSNYWNLLFYSHGSLSSGMRRCHRCDFTTFPIRRKHLSGHRNIIRSTQQGKLWGPRRTPQELIWSWTSKLFYVFYTSDD